MAQIDSARKRASQFSLALCGHMIMEIELKEQFFLFVQDLVKNGWDKKAWEKYAVNHYQDAALEEIRKELVRVCISDKEFVGNALPSKKTTEKITKMIERLKLLTT